MSPGLHSFAASLMVALPMTALRSQKGYMTFMVAWHSPWWTFHQRNNNTLYFLYSVEIDRCVPQGYRMKVEGLRTIRLACEATGIGMRC